MEFTQSSRPYANFLLTNGYMAAGFLLLYFTGYASKSMALLLLSVLFACLCFVVELLLGIMAAISGRLLLAALYGAVSLALFFADSWLLKQAE